VIRLKRKTISIFLSLILVFISLPLGAIAQESIWTPENIGQSSYVEKVELQHRKDVYSDHYRRNIDYTIKRWASAAGKDIRASWRVGTNKGTFEWTFLNGTQWGSGSGSIYPPTDYFTNKADHRDWNKNLDFYSIELKLEGPNGSETHLFPIKPENTGWVTYNFEEGTIQSLVFPIGIKADGDTLLKTIFEDAFNRNINRSYTEGAWATGPVQEWAGGWWQPLAKETNEYEWQRGAIMYKKQTDVNTTTEGTSESLPGDEPPDEDMPAKDIDEDSGDPDSGENPGSTIAYIVHGGIWERYKGLGGPDSFLGYPLTDEIPFGMCTNSGISPFYQKFEGGEIWYHDGGSYNGKSFIAQGEILNAWKTLGGVTSILGMPISDEYNFLDGKRQDFENGHWLFWSSEKGIVFDDGLPYIFGIEPGSGVPGDIVTISGVNFKPWDIVRFGGLYGGGTAEIISCSWNELIVQVPIPFPPIAENPLNLPTNPVKVYIVDLLGQPLSHNFIEFTYKNPVIFDIHPSYGGASSTMSEQSIVGDDFGSDGTFNEVYFGLSPATKVFYKNNEIIVNPPSDYGLGIEAAGRFYDLIMTGLSLGSSTLFELGVDGLSQFIPDLVDLKLDENEPLWSRFAKVVAVIALPGVAVHPTGDVTVDVKVVSNITTSNTIPFTFFSDDILDHCKENTLIWCELHSPGELRIYDSHGNVAGIVNGQTCQEIPNSVCNGETIAVFPANDTYQLEVVGTDQGTYGLELSAAKNGTVVAFNATNVPTSASAIHQYIVDWNVLKKGQDGVTVKVDSEGDGIFESTFSISKTLSQEEFILNADKTPPVITIDSPINGNTYILNQEVIASWVASDTSGLYKSGLESASASSIDTSSVGTKIFKVEAIDRAGNKAIKEVTYHVCYGYSGIFKPINADGSSIFKLGSTVPVKFQLKDANGNIVKANNNPTIGIEYMGSNSTGTAWEPHSTSAANIGNQFRYDDISQQYIYNLGTKGLLAGAWKIKILLDDGTSKEVLISLKKPEILPSVSGVIVFNDQKYNRSFE